MKDHIEKLPRSILVWIVGAIILLGLLSPITCQIDLSSLPVDPNSYGHHQLDLGKKIEKLQDGSEVYEKEGIRLILAPNGELTGLTNWKGR